MDTLNAREKLKQLIDAGMTEAEIATATGITQPTINRIKNGQEPRETYVRLIDRFFLSQSKRLKKFRQDKGHHQQQKAAA